MFDRKVGLEEVMPLLMETLAAGNTFTFGPKGTSMLPMIVMGRDTVELTAAPEKLGKYDLPLYRRDDGQYVLHRIVRTGETYTCIGDNQFQYEQGIRRDQIIGVVCAFTHDGKRWLASDRQYRLYCMLWHKSRSVRHIWRRAKGFLRRRFKK